ncbi:MAG: hypothetical protein JWP58_4460 [Hymenobacter sp.]|nr:hypothetical protein [Hymenobacter sp.]
MKNTAHRQPQKTTEDARVHLTGLSAKYVRKLEKPLVNTLRKLSRKFSKLLDKNRKAARKATREAARFLVKRLYKSVEWRGAGPALRPA